MDVSYDPVKNARNITERGLSFELVQQFDWSTAVVAQDCRYEYAEHRFQALGKIHDRLHMLVFTPRNDVLHVISLRKANAREVSRYDQDKQNRS